MPELGTRALYLDVDGNDFSDAVSKVVIMAGDQEDGFESFADVAAGGAREYKLMLTLKQDTSTSGLWYYIWNSAGTTVAVECWPNGYNSGTPSTTYPQFTGNVVITEPDGELLGGEANRSVSARFTTEVEWQFTQKPTMTTA